MSQALRSKNSLKEDFRAHIRTLLEKERPFESALIQTQISLHLQYFLETQPAGCWMGFYPMRQEPQWMRVLESVRHLTWAFPKVDGEQLKIFKNVKNFKKGTFQIYEPEDGEEISIRDVQGCLVPGLAFSKKNGLRLGRGGGYYDRALENFQGVRVGLCYAVQLLETEVPSESHDLCMHHVVTEDGFYKVS